MLRFFERVDDLEKRVLQLEQERDELADLLCEYVDSDLELTWRKPAERLVEALRARQAMRAAASRTVR
jgi:hypothetical protein